MRKKLSEHVNFVQHKKNILTAMRFANTIWSAESAGRFGRGDFRDHAGDDDLTMKLPRFFAARSGVILFTLAWTGCQTHTTVVPLKNGYEEVSHPYHTLIDEPEPPRISFQHRGTNDAVTPIWPSLYGVNDVIRGDLAIFVAEKAAITPERVTHPRLFAVRAPELPLDLTDEVLWRWSQANGRDFPKTLQKFAMITPEEKNGGLELYLEFWTPSAYAADQEDWPDKSSLQLDWRQIDEIMRRVKTKGVVEKDLRWHTDYIGEKF